MTTNTADPPPVRELPPSCRAIVQALEGADGKLTRQELMRRTYHSSSTMTDALRSLETRGWILRSQHPDDLRRVTVELRHSPET